MKLQYVVVILYLSLISSVNAVSLKYDICETTLIDLTVNSELWLTSSYPIAVVAPPDVIYDKMSIQFEKGYISSIKSKDEGTLLINPAFGSGCNLTVNVFDPDKKRLEIRKEEILKENEEKINELTSKLSNATDEISSRDNTIFDRERDLSRLNFELESVKQNLSIANKIIESDKKIVETRFVIVDNPTTMRLFFDTLISYVGMGQLLRMHWEYFGLAALAGMGILYGYKKHKVSGE